MLLIFIGKSISLKDIRILIHWKHRHEIDEVPLGARDFAMTISIPMWKGKCLETFEKVKNLLRSRIKEESKRIFASFPTPGIASDVPGDYRTYLVNDKAVSDKAYEILDTVAERTWSLIESYCDWESRKPFTYDKTYFDNWRYNVFRHICEERYYAEPADEQENPDLGQSPVVEDLKGLIDLASDGPKIRSDKELNARLRKDEYSKELEIVAESAAYFHVAYKRIIDVIPMYIENIFLIGLGVELRNELDKKLGLCSVEVSGRD
jgi:hypothetical protein